jgi:hypothetical protein
VLSVCRRCAGALLIHREKERRTRGVEAGAAAPTPAMLSAHGADQDWGVWTWLGPRVCLQDACS